MTIPSFARVTALAAARGLILPQTEREGGSGGGAGAAAGSGAGALQRVHRKLVSLHAKTETVLVHSVVKAARLQALASTCCKAGGRAAGTHTQAAVEGGLGGVCLRKQKNNVTRACLWQNSTV